MLTSDKNFHFNWKSNNNENSKIPRLTFILQPLMFWTVFYQRCFGQLGSKTRGFVIGKASRWAGTKTLEIIILGAFLKNKRVLIVLRVKSSVNIWILVNGIQWTRVNLMRLFLWNYLTEKNSSFLVVSTYTKADSFVTYSRLVFEVMCIEKVWDNTGC